MRICSAFWHYFHNNCAHTLLELLITLAILVIIAAGGVASWSRLLAHHRWLSVERSIRTRVAAAKSLAATTGKVITLCPSRDHRHCSGDWASEWLILADSKQVKRVFAPLPPGMECQWHGLGANTQLKVAPLVMHDNMAGRFDCVDSLGVHKRLMLSRHGWVRLTG